MIKSLSYQRIGLLTLVLVAAFGGLAYRLVDLQILRHAELQARAHDNTQRTLHVAPRRGDILDSRGHLLATSIFVKTVCADPSLIGTRHAEMARVLAPLLDLKEAELAERLKPRVVRLDTNGAPVIDQHVILKQKVKLETWEKVQRTLTDTNLNFGVPLGTGKSTNRQFLKQLKTKAIFAEDDQQRLYPNERLAAHILGYMGSPEMLKTEKLTSGFQRFSASAFQQFQQCGIDGIERTMDAQLDGARGWRQTERDNRGRELVALRQQDVEARDGLNVVLTLDLRLQEIVETELAAAMQKHTPISISGIIVRPRTGEILALATLPNYDPNKLDCSKPEERRNRVITDIAEPGSTFKIVVVSGGLNDQIVNLTDSIDCEGGRFLFAGKVLGDDHHYGVLSVEEIIGKSSNIGAAKIGIKLGETKLYEYIRNFGFGARTGIPLGGEVFGIVKPLDKWTKLSISRIPMGHEVAVTPLQMVMAMCVIANGGWLMRPMLVDRLEDSEHKLVTKYHPYRVRQVINETAARQMVTALKTVVSPSGTAPKAALDHYTVAGKTGTAQKIVNGKYTSEKHYSSFIGFFPADDPELCISVVMDEPKQGYYGGQTAAPVFKQIAERAANYLNIRPDRIEPSPLLESVIDNNPNITGKKLSFVNHETSTKGKK